MNHAITITSPEVRDLLAASLKWIRRIEERADSLPPSFMDNIDITPLRKELQAFLNGEISPKSAAVVEQVFIASGAAK